MDCATCGLTPADLPLGVDPDVVFDRDDDGEIRCQGCIGRGVETLEAS